MFEASLGPRHINLVCVVWQSEIVSVFNALCNEISTYDTRTSPPPPGIRLNRALRPLTHWTPTNGPNNLHGLSSEVDSNSSDQENNLRPYKVRNCIHKSPRLNVILC